MKIATIFTSRHSIFKRIMGVTGSLRTNSVGRTLLKINDKYQFTTYNKTRKLIKFCKILRHPIDSQRRRKLARRLLGPVDISFSRCKWDKSAQIAKHFR